MTLENIAKKYVREWKHGMAELEDLKEGLDMETLEAVAMDFARYAGGPQDRRDPLQDDMRVPFVESELSTVRDLLRFIGEDASREGLADTPRRVLAAWAEWTSGYKCEPASLLKVFEDGAEQTDQMIVVQDIPVWSHCEHHLAPFFGKATIGYLPDGRIVGLSKLARVVDCFARRLQVQERLTNQIADLLHAELKPLGVGVIIKCRHLCMESRGVKTHDSSTLTSALRGAFLETPEARAEFMKLKV